MGSLSSKEVSYGLIDYCVVIEMVGFAIAHSYTFTYKEYLPGHLPAAAAAEHDATNDGDGGGEQSVFAAAAPPPSRRVVSGASSDPENGLDGNNGNTRTRRTTRYQPPATLPQPMNFREALWSSTLPRETIEDIQKLRANLLERGHSDIAPRANISMQELTGNEDTNDLRLTDNVGEGDGDVDENTDTENKNDEEQPPIPKNV